MTFAALFDALTRLPDEASLVFQYNGTSIQGGYHVTELRLSDTTSIDCSGTVTRFTETRLQLLDGYGGAHMTVGTFRTILKQSLARLPALADAPFMVEFAPKNEGLMLLTPSEPVFKDGRAELSLNRTTAVCRPFERRRSDHSGKTCCNPAA